MGGSDQQRQWSHHKKNYKKEAFGITSPLVTNNDGSKMGKTADGAVWLNKEKISSLDFFQFWRNVNDQDLSRFLYLFTKLPIEEVKKLSTLRNQEINEAKKILLLKYEIVRGIEDADEALEIAGQDLIQNIDQRLQIFHIMNQI